LSRYLLADEPLPDGELCFFSADYQEFACSKATATRLQTEGMRIDGRRVTTKITCDFGPNVMVGYFWRNDAE